MNFVNSRLEHNGHDIFAKTESPLTSEPLESDALKVELECLATILSLSTSTAEETMSLLVSILQETTGKQITVNDMRALFQSMGSFPKKEDFLSLVRGKTGATVIAAIPLPRVRIKSRELIFSEPLPLDERQQPASVQQIQRIIRHVPLSANVPEQTLFSLVLEASSILQRPVTVIDISRMLFHFPSDASSVQKLLHGRNDWSVVTLENLSPGVSYRPSASDDDSIDELLHEDPEIDHPLYSPIIRTALSAAETEAECNRVPLTSRAIAYHIHRLCKSSGIAFEPSMLVKANLIIAHLPKNIAAHIERGLLADSGFEDKSIFEAAIIGQMTSALSAALLTSSESHDRISQDFLKISLQYAPSLQNALDLQASRRHVGKDKNINTYAWPPRFFLAKDVTPSKVKHSGEAPLPMDIQSVAHQALQRFSALDKNWTSRPLDPLSVTMFVESALIELLHLESRQYIWTQLESIAQLDPDKFEAVSFASSEGGAPRSATEKEFDQEEEVFESLHMVDRPIDRLYEWASAIWFKAKDFVTIHLHTRFIPPIHVSGTQTIHRTAASLNAADIQNVLKELHTEIDSIITDAFSKKAVLEVDEVVASTED